MLEPGQSGAVYADRIEAAWNDPPAYRRVARAARQAYRERLNWDSAGSEVVRLLRECLAQLRAVA